MAHLAPLPQDALQLEHKASAAHTLALSTVDDLIERLEQARAVVASGGTAQEGGGGQGTALADTLLPLSSYVKSANTKVQQAGKDWGNALSRLAKDADKKFGAPPPPLFAPPAPPPAPPKHLHPSIAALMPPSSSSLTSSSFPSSSAASSTTPFSSPTSLAALHSSIALHLARLGAFDSLATFLAESGTAPPAELVDADTGALGGEVLDGLRELHGLVEEIRAGQVGSAIEWLEGRKAGEAVEERETGKGGVDDDGELEWLLRREEFIRLVLSSSSSDAPSDATDPPAVAPDDAMDTDSAAPSLSSSTAALKPPTAHPSAHRALSYGGSHFRRLLTPQRSSDICALLTAPLYLPLPRLLASPYGGLFAPYLPPCPAAMGVTPAPTAALVEAFAAAYLGALGLPQDSPLAVVTDVGGNGALAKIMKVRQVMKEKKTEWTAVGELPVEIPLPVRYRYHSVFACPVSKEQSTAQNPPMLLPCGHVIARESAVRLARGTPTLKCPYCPIVSHFSACVRVHF
ncbi:hypothetical protein JCM10207_009112 [Rhodosporidiobolus poonsookiae]